MHSNKEKGKITREKIYNYIRSCWLQGYIPSFSEISQDLKISRGNLYRQTEELQRQGWIQKRGKAGLQILQSGQPFQDNYQPKEKLKLDLASFLANFRADSGSKTKPRKSSQTIIKIG